MSRAQGSGGLGGNTRLCSPIGFAFVTPRTEPGVTELPGLTSDPVLTADRRGGILISFGLPRTSLEGINPPKRMSSRASRARPRKSAAKTGVAGLGFACFGFHRTSLEGINPPKRCRRRRAELASGIHPEGRIERPSTSLAFCIPSECPVPLKGVGFLLRRSFPTDLRISLQIATNS